MTVLEEAMSTSKSVFFVHKNMCAKCGHMVMHKTATLRELCHEGTLLYKKLLKAEDDIVKHEKAKETARVNKAIRREAFKEMQ